MPNSIIREENVKSGLLKMHKLWVMLLAVAVVSLLSVCFLALNDRPDIKAPGAKVCQELLSNITQPQKINEAWSLRHVKLMQTCCWKFNATALAQYRAELGRCCNASAWLAVTQDNTPLGSKIVYDGYQSASLKVSNGLMEILPEKSPFLLPLYESCAVVGNGGILRNSSCGSKIDAHQFVIRFNLPSVNFPEDVGRKSSIVTVNPSILHKRFRGLNGRRLPFVKAAASYGETWFLIPAFSYPGGTEASYRAVYALLDSASQSHAFFFHPHYLSALSKYWHDHGFHTRRLSSGFMLVNAALELCQHITLYGFWPFSLHPDGHSLPHHYYDNVLPDRRLHIMPKEFTYYVDMHFHGVLQLHVGRC
ncbi:alpha-N-acetylneuraminide alpha-2,8-sialyltransferase-like [Dryobates pubescens]|uniref:alpha-N-acetylneuraminide alpha-2,8-sialyltransferase-like n=1 Tax=Dryobates pubescens TaxID=118200 RepID=UPI0023B8E0EF|nr:alpha-N-acetylneuraminide alpha-2,8-sialyltransferase-like [Dryobates pubescens]